MEVAYLCTSGVRSRPRCQKLLATMHELATAHDLPELRGWYSAVSGLAHYQWGEFAEAHKDALEASEILRNTAGLTFEHTSNELYALWAMYYTGEVGELARRVPRLMREAEDRGDRYTVANLSTGICQLAWLVRDDAAGARHASHQAEQSWSHRTYHLQHYWQLLGRLQTELYAGDAVAAWKAYTAGWPQYQRSLFKRIEIVANEADSFAARVHLAASKLTDSAHRIKTAEQLAFAMEKRGPAYAVALGQMIRAGVAARRGQPEAAADLLAQAENGFAAASMRMHVSVARWRRGQLLGGDPGKTLLDGARAELWSQTVARPEAMVDLFGPGFD
jgi:hypothetical protein